MACGKTCASSMCGLAGGLCKSRVCGGVLPRAGAYICMHGSLEGQVADDADAELTAHWGVAATS